MPKMIDSGTPSTTEPTTIPMAPPVPSSPNRRSTSRSPARKTATPISIQTEYCQCDSASACAMRSNEIADSIAPAPNPARMPTTLRDRVIQQTATPATRSEDCATAPSPKACSKSENDICRTFVSHLGAGVLSG